MLEIDPVQDGGRATLEFVAARSAAQMGSENFPVALRVLPRQPRIELASVYAYARFVDDVGDEAAGDRCALLDLVEQEVRALAAGDATLPAVTALAPIIDAHDIPLDPLLDLIEANRRDQRTSRYKCFEDLLAYCELSAAPIGRLVLYIANAASARNVVDSDAVCAALQVLEHCQDVGEDARSGRVYLPASDLQTVGLAADELLAGTTSLRLRRAVATNVDRSHSMLRAAGRPLVRRLSGWAKFAVAGYVAGGLATVDALRRNEYDVLARDVRPSRVRTAARMAQLLAHR